MGIEITIDSLEDMCLLMCDNVIPKGKEGEHDGEREAGSDREREAENTEHLRAGR